MIFDTRDEALHFFVICCILCCSYFVVLYETIAFPGREMKIQGSQIHFYYLLECNLRANGVVFVSVSVRGVFLFFSALFVFVVMCASTQIRNFFPSTTHHHHHFQRLHFLRFTITTTPPHLLLCWLCCCWGSFISARWSCVCAIRYRGGAPFLLFFFSRSLLYCFTLARGVHSIMQRRRRSRASVCVPVDTGARTCVCVLC